MDTVSRRLKCLMLTSSVLRRHNIGSFQMTRGDAINLNEVVAFIKRLGEKEFLPRDTVVTWVWYSPRHNAYGLLLWSEMFDIVPDAYEAPFVETV